MRKLALALLLVSGIAAADSTIKLSYEAKDNPKALATMKAEAAKHLDVLDKAAHGKAFELHIVLKKLEQAADTTKCNLAISVGAPGNSLAAVITGGASTKGVGETSAEDCIGATLADLLDKKVTVAIEQKAK